MPLENWHLLILAGGMPIVHLLTMAAESLAYICASKIMHVWVNINMPLGVLRWR